MTTNKERRTSTSNNQALGDQRTPALVEKRDTHTGILADTEAVVRRHVTTGTRLTHKQQAATKEQTGGSA